MKIKMCVDTQKPPPQRKPLSNIGWKDLKGNWPYDEQKVPKKVKLITLQAYQSHKYQKTKHKRINS